MGSPRYELSATPSFLVTDVWFLPGTVLPRHRHARPILGVMMEGGFDDVFSRRTIEPGAGCLFTEPAEEPHSNRIGAAGARVLVLQPDPSDPDLWAVAGRTLDEIRSVPHPSAMDNARRLSRELRDPDELSPFAIEALALDILVAAGRFERSGGEPVWLSRVDELVRDSFREQLRVWQIADEVGVHRGHLARVYREHRGIPISDHIRRLRVEWAAERLTTSTADISSIAFAAGFADQSHLTRAFTRAFGLPPARYREVFSA